MSSVSAAPIPYEGQADPQTRRDCGAACLSMVYRSLGKEVSQDEIWPAIAKPSRFGAVSSTTYLMAQDALNRGFAAVAIQARHPLQALRLYSQSGTRAILNHRLAQDSPLGHYSVLVDMDEHEVVLHDPLYGPSRRIPCTELLELWKPRPVSEIAGYTLIAIAAEPPSVAPCSLCHAPVPHNFACPRCKRPVDSSATALLGCTNHDCVARVWNLICCPSCDCTFSLGAPAPVLPVESAELNGLPSGSNSPRTSARDSVDLNPVFAAVDKFCSQILTIPGARDHPEIKRQLDIVASSKEKLKLAHAEALVHRKAHLERLTEMLQTAKQNEEAHRQKVTELNRPSPPLDGDALARALLSNLGLVKYAR